MRHLILKTLTSWKSLYDKWKAYAQAKTAVVLFTIALDKLYKESGIRAFAVHPGGIVTGLSSSLTDEKCQSWERLGGVYCENADISPLYTPGNEVTGVKEYAIDKELALELWENTEGLFR